jgi:hypothetical protein
MTEGFDNIVREYIDFVNAQVGVYMDAMAGFENVKLKTERQVHRVRRRTGMTIDEAGNRIVVWTSFEDPSQPDIIHNQIVRANTYVAANSPGGTNEQQLSQSILVFLVAYWESSIRPRLAQERGVEIHEIKSNVMGDLTIVRNSILHSKAIIKSKEHKRLKSLSEIFVEERKVFVPYESMHKIFIMIKQDLARLLFDWLGINEPLVSPDQIRDLAVQKIGGGS